MSLLERDHLIDDDWVSVADEAALPGDAPVIVSLKRLEVEHESLIGRNAPLGVVLGPDAKPEAIAADLDRLGLIVVEFLKFRDGRGFTIARTLRERYGFAGELRAKGAILPDQHAFLLRCGFTTVEVPAGQDPARWTELLHDIDIAYQPAVTDDRAFSLLRRHVAAAE